MTTHAVFLLCVMLVDVHFDEFFHGAFRFTNFIADSIVQLQLDFACNALHFNLAQLLSFWANTSIPNTFEQSYYQVQQGFIENMGKIHQLFHIHQTIKESKHFSWDFG